MFDFLFCLRFGLKFRAELCTQILPGSRNHPNYLMYHCQNAMIYMILLLFLLISSCPTTPTTTTTKPNSTPEDHPIAFMQMILHGTGPPFDNCPKFFQECRSIVMDSLEEMFDMKIKYFGFALRCRSQARCVRA